MKKPDLLFHSLLHQGKRRHALGTRDIPCCSFIPFFIRASAGTLCTNRANTELSFIPFFIRASAGTGGERIVTGFQCFAKADSRKYFRPKVDLKMSVIVPCSFRFSTARRRRSRHRIAVGSWSRSCRRSDANAFS